MSSLIWWCLFFVDLEDVLSGPIPRDCGHGHCSKLILYVNRHVCKQDVRNDNWGICECPICGQTLSTIPGQSSLRVLASLGVASRNEGVTLKGWWRASKFKWLESETNHILILPAAHGSLYQYVQTYTCTQICIFFCRSLHPGNFTWLAREKHTFSIASSKILNVSECYLATNGKRHENTNGLYKFFFQYECVVRMRVIIGVPIANMQLWSHMYIFYFQTHLYHIVA